LTIIDRRADKEVDDFVDLVEEEELERVTT